jgi:hypothetical protein
MRIAAMTRQTVCLLTVLVLVGFIGPIHAQGFDELVLPGPQPQQVKPKPQQVKPKPQPAKPRPRPQEANNTPAIAPTPVENPSDRYRALDPNGAIIEDRTTGLQWQRCSIGQQWNGDDCNGEAERLTWDEAMSLAAGLSFAGQSDWRVPTIDELRSLVFCSSGQPGIWQDRRRAACEGDYARPTIVQTAFPNTPDSVFWSSSPRPDNSEEAWLVYFYFGDVGYNSKAYDGRVRLVRGGR